MLSKKLIKELKEKLEEQKKSLENQLHGFAKKDKNLKGDWDTKFPNFKGASSSSGNLEEAADEVEEYTSLLPIEHALETRLQDTTLALEEIKRGKYGKCENCKKEISVARLKIIPDARTCNKCK